VPVQLAATLLHVLRLGKCTYENYLVLTKAGGPNAFCLFFTWSINGGEIIVMNREEVKYRAGGTSFGFPFLEASLVLRIL
jgi:hypothetical protein